jgi:hypothetical protein
MAGEWPGASVIHGGCNSVNRKTRSDPIPGDGMESWNSHRYRVHAVDDL